jgi:hypothetical protein
MDTTRDDFMTVTAYAREVLQIRLTLQEAMRFGQRATNRCRELSVTPGKAPDPRFGHVNRYARRILDWAWNSLCEEGGWAPYWRLQDRYLNERWAEGERIIAAAADGLHAWEEKYEDLGLTTDWSWCDWPNDGDAELEWVKGELEDKIAEVEEELENLKAFKLAVDNALGAAASFPEIISMIERIRNDRDG